MLYENYSTNKGYRLKFGTERLLDFTKSPYNYKQFNGFITTAGRVNYSFRKQVSIIRNDVLNIYGTMFKRLEDLGVSVIDERIFIKIMKEVTSIIGL